MFVSLQVYRNSVIAQWKAMNLDVLLTPMLGPALDLNASGRATGEACCASPEALIPSSPSEFSPVHCGVEEGEFWGGHPVHGGASCSSPGTSLIGRLQT